MAQRALAPFISVYHVFHRAKSIPRFVVGSDETTISKVLDVFNTKQGFHEFENDKDCKLELKPLKNMMLFYDEKANYKPIEHLSYIDQMKDVYENPPTYIVDSNLTPELWRNYRNAYLPLIK